jgi:hypothetical protein
MGNVSVKAHGHMRSGHMRSGHNNKHMHNKNIKRTRHHKYHNNNGGGLTPSKTTRKVFKSRSGFNKSISVGRSFLSKKAKEAYVKSKQHDLVVKVNTAEGSRVFSGKRTPKKQIAKMDSFEEE